MSEPTNRRTASVSLLENLKVTISGSMLKSNIRDWERTHEVPRYNRMYYFVRGEGSIELNGARYTPQPGQLFILPAGTVQTFRTSPDNPYMRYYCDFYANIGEWPLFQPSGQAFWATIKDPEDLIRSFEELILHYRKPTPGSYLRAQASLIRLLSVCLEDGGYDRFMEDNHLVSPEQHKLAVALNYIQSRLAHPVSVDELAEQVHFHPNYFIAFFKKHMGVSPMHYVQRQKMEEAKRLLLSTVLPVSEIAAAVGMDFLNFSKQFKRSVGLSPSVYRNSAH